MSLYEVNKIIGIINRLVWSFNSLYEWNPWNSICSMKLVTQKCIWVNNFSLSMSRVSQVLIFWIRIPKGGFTHYRSRESHSNFSTTNTLLTTNTRHEVLGVASPRRPRSEPLADYVLMISRTIEAVWIVRTGCFAAAGMPRCAVWRAPRGKLPVSLQKYWVSSSIPGMAISPADRSDHSDLVGTPAPGGD